MGLRCREQYKEISRTMNDDGIPILGRSIQRKSTQKEDRAPYLKAYVLEV